MSLKPQHVHDYQHWCADAAKAVAYLAIALYALGRALRQQLDDITGRAPIHRSQAARPLLEAAIEEPRIEILYELEACTVKTLRRLARDRQHEGFWPDATPIHLANKSQLIQHLRSVHSGPLA